VSVLELRGGTDAAMAPPAAYLSDVLAPLLRHLYGDLLADLSVDTVSGQRMRALLTAPPCMLAVASWEHKVC
jgi:hypothetical protein